MRYFRVEACFIGLSREKIESKLDLKTRNSQTKAEGEWKFDELEPKDGPDSAKMTLFKLITPLLTFSQIDVLIDVFTSLHGIGCIIDRDQPLKIYYLGDRYYYGLSRRIIYELVEEDEFLHGLLRYRKYYSLLPFYARESVEGYDEGFVSRKAYLSSIKNEYNSLLVDELIADSLLKGSRPSR